MVRSDHNSLLDDFIWARVRGGDDFERELLWARLQSLFTRPHSPVTTTRWWEFPGCGAHPSSSVFMDHARGRLLNAGPTQLDLGWAKVRGRSNMLFLFFVFSHFNSNFSFNFKFKLEFKFPLQSECTVKTPSWSAMLSFIYYLTLLIYTNVVIMQNTHIIHFRKTLSWMCSYISSILRSSYPFVFIENIFQCLIFIKI
jgi:hypothetical protein